MANQTGAQHEATPRGPEASHLPQQRAAPAPGGSSPALQKLIQALVQQKGFLPIQKLALPELQAFPAEKYDFVGIREYLGSISTIGLVNADPLGEPELIDRCRQFASLTEGLQQHAGRLWVGLASTRLGSFGVLCFVFEREPSEAVIERVQQQRRILFLRKVHSVYWVIDARSRKIHPHRGLPLSTFPGKRYLEGVLRQEQS